LGSSFGSDADAGLKVQKTGKTETMERQNQYGSQFETGQSGAEGATAQAAAGSLHRRPMHWWTEAVLRPAGTVIVIALAVAMTIHVIQGQHGLSVWFQMRSEERDLQKEIGDLQKENEQLRKQIGHLQSDPDAIARVAREKLHYARPDEVIYTLPANEQAPAGGQQKQ